MEPIHLAAWEGNLGELNRLLEADPGLLNVRAEQTGIVGLLSIMHERPTPLMVAAMCGHEPIVQRLLELGADVGVRDRMGDSAAHYACKYDRADCLKLLLDAGAPIDAQNVIRITPFLKAVVFAFMGSDCMKLLLARGADPNVKDFDGATSLHAAARHRDPQFLQMLLNAGADPTVRTHKRAHRPDRTPLDTAREAWEEANVQLLKKAVSELDRPPALFKARSLLDAARAVGKAKQDAGTLVEKSRAAVAAAPAYLKGRAADGREMPVSLVWRLVEDEQVVGAAKLAVGVEVEWAKPLPEELFVELMGFLVPPWDPTRRGLPLGGEEYA